MVQSHWLDAVNGNFDTASDWSTHAVPGPSDDAILDASGPNYFTVSVTQDATVNSIQLDATAFLNIEANFTATNGTGTGANDGAIQVQNGDTLTLQGTVNNVGSITLFGTTSTTSLVLGSGGVTLEGGGAVFLNFGGNDQQIVPAAGGSVLTDVNDRISGIGLLGGAGLTIINETGGFIEAKSGSLIINTGANTIINAGLIDAEGAPDSGGLPPGLGTVESPVDSSGFLKADGVGSVMTFNDAVTGTGRTVIAGGTLNFKAYFNQDVAFEATSGDLILAQSVNYTSLIQEFSTTGGEFLDLGDIGFVSAGEATYSGTTNGGMLTVTDGVHTANIHFEGNYTGVAFVASSDGHGGTSITTAESKALHWLNPVNGSFQTASDWTGGLVPGPGANAVLDAAGSTDYTVTASTTQTVAGIQTASTAILGVTGAFTATAGTDGGSNAGRIAIGAGGAFTAGGAIDNTGLISLDGSTGTSRLVVSGSLTLAGGGEVYMGDSASDIVVGSSASAILDNIANTIAGAGDIGDGELALINGAAGKIESEEPSTPMVIDTGANTIVNAGLIEAAGAGASIMSPVNNSGFLKADGGNLTVNGAVSGAGGDGVVYNGTLRFNALFNQNVDFEGLSGTLYLAKSANYTSLVAGFSTTGTESLDLGDIGFVGSGEASFSGTTTGGVLTVTDGTHTARVHLEGNYTGVAFIAGSDGSGGTSVTTAATKTLHWLNPVNGTFQTAADWAGAIVPGPGADAVLDAPGSTPYTVSDSQNTTVNSIQSASSATLDVNAGDFTATNGSGLGADAGTINVADGATLSAGGTFDNTGVLDLLGTSLGADLTLGGSGLTLTGGGEVILADSLPAPTQPSPPSNALDRVSGAAGTTLTNVDNTITGAGTVGLGGMSLVNEAKGVIDASLGTDLVLDVGTLSNGGLLEGTGAGGLYIVYSTVDNASGDIAAGPGSVVYMSYSDIIGGTLTSSGTGLIYNDWGPIIWDGSTAGAVTNKAYVFVSDGASLTFEGAIDNMDEIEVGTDLSPAVALIVGAVGATLTGGGEIVLGGGDSGTGIDAAAAGATLANVNNTISGQGQIGAGSLVLINEAGGVIDADATFALTLNTGVETIVNAGLIEATRPAGATIVSPLANSGTIAADGGNLTVDGAVTGATGAAVVENATLRFNGAFNQNVAFEGSKGILYLAQSLDYTGAISGFSTVAGADLLDLGDIGFMSAGEATFSGTTSGGVLTVTDGTHTSHINLEGNYSGVAFTAGSDGSGGTTVSDRPSASKILHWLNPVNGAFQTATAWTAGFVPGANNDAVLDAAGSTTYTVTASTAQTVAGIQTATTAILGVTNAFTATNGTDGGVNAGRIAIGAGGTFTAGGTLGNSGLVSFTASSSVEKLVVAGSLSLTGGGEIFLSASANDIIVGSSASATLTNVANVIAGGGELGGGELTLINQAGGKIESEEASSPMVINTGANTIINAGLIESAGAGTGAVIVSPIANSGTLKADGGNLTVDGAVTGSGGDVVYDGTLRFNAAFSQNVTFEGTSGTLYLAQSAGYAGAISGFSTTGANSLDLGDIGFVNGGEATFSGTTGGGVLTVTDGTHTAHIRLTGNYTASSFVTSADGHGGTIVVDPTAAASLTHQFIAAAASFGVGRGAALAETHDTRRAEMQSLARPT